MCNLEEMDKIEPQNMVLCIFNLFFKYIRATLIRSATPFSINSPHTGGTWYDDDVPSICTAAISVEDAAMFERMHKRGQTIKLNLVLES